MVIADFDTDPDRPGAGSTFEARLKLRNVGEHLAENVQVSMSGDAFLPAGESAMPYTNKLDEGDSVEVKTRLRVSAGIAAGVYSLVITLRWDDSYGASYSDSTSVGIEVSGSRPVVVVTAARLPGRVSPGVPFVLTLELVNSGGSEARNVLVSPTGGPLALRGGTGQGPLTMGAGAVASLELEVMAAAVPVPGATSQELEVRYDDPSGQRYVESQAVGLVVIGEAGTGPILIVESHATEPTELSPGEAFELMLTLTNVGGGDALRARITLGGGSSSASQASGLGLGVFAPLTTSNVRYVGLIAAGASRALTQNMVVDGSAKPGVYTLSVGLDFVDRDGQPHQDSQVVTLLVSRRLALEIRPIDVVTSTVVGEPLQLGVEIINTGADDINVTNAEVVADRYMAVEGSPMFVGTLQGGDVDVMEVTLTPKAPSARVVVTVRVYYIDDFNRQQSVEEELEFVIEAAPERPTSPTAEEAGAGADEGNMIVRIVKGLLGLGASPPGGGIPASAYDDLDRVLSEQQGEAVIGKPSSASSPEE